MGAAPRGGSVPVAELRTERLLLRQWRPSDRQPFARLNGDPETMRYFPAPLHRAQSDALADRCAAALTQRGWGLWAVEVVGERSNFVGFVGLNVPTFNAHFTPCVEVGWRLLRCSWGNGYATEAGRAAVRYGFEQLALTEIVSFTSAINERSRRVMERLEMTHDPADDFDHPAVQPGPLRRHVLYRLTSPR